MSNPIADTAEYFADKERIKNSKPNLRIFPSQDQQASPTTTANPQDLLSPESPESRRPPAPQHSNLSDFDPKAQWQKVLKRLPNRHAGKSDQEGSSLSSSSSSSDDDTAEYGSQHDVYEMNRFGRPYRQKKRKNKYQQQQYDDQDDILPDANDISKQGENHVEPPSEEEPQAQDDDNYFVNPFEGSSGDVSHKSTPDTAITPTMEDVMEKKQEKKLKKKLKQQQGAGSSSSRHSSSSSSSDSDGADQDNSPINPSVTTPPTSPSDGGRAKKHWGKTLDKVRLIANLHTLPQQTKAAVNSTSSLAPYYPPLFDPVFIALSKDQHGHPWVSKHTYKSKRMHMPYSRFPYIIATCFTSLFESKSICWVTPLRQCTLSFNFFFFI